MRTRWKTAILVGSLAVAGFAAVEFGACARADGIYTLDVTIRREGLPNMRQVWYVLLSEGGANELVMQGVVNGHSLAPARMADGDRVLVQVPFGVKISPLGRRYAWWQDRGLVRVVGFDDGTWGVVVATVPDGRRARAMTATITRSNLTTTAPSGMMPRTSSTEPVMGE